MLKTLHLECLLSYVIIIHIIFLGLFIVPSPHTKDVLVDCFLEWNIDRKLFTITVDNYSTNDAMIRLLLNKLNTSSLMLGESMLHMRCATHIWNLIVQDGLSLMGDGIERIYDSVIYWTKGRNSKKMHINCVFNAPKS